MNTYNFEMRGWPAKGGEAQVPKVHDDIPETVLKFGTHATGRDIDDVV